MYIIFYVAIYIFNVRMCKTVVIIVRKSHAHA